MFESWNPPIQSYSLYNTHHDTLRQKLFISQATTSLIHKIFWIRKRRIFLTTVLSSMISSRSSIFRSLGSIVLVLALGSLVTAAPTSTSTLDARSQELSDPFGATIEDFVRLASLFCDYSLTVQTEARHRRNRRRGPKPCKSGRANWVRNLRGFHERVRRLP